MADETQKKNSVDPQLVAQLGEVQKGLERERQAREATEAKLAEQDRLIAERDRHAAIRAELDKYNLQGGPKMRDILFKSLKDDIKTDDEGHYVTENGLSLSEFLEEKFAADFSHFLVPALQPANAGSSAIDVDSIKPGADNSAAREQIRKLLGQQKQAQG